MGFQKEMFFPSCHFPFWDPFPVPFFQNFKSVYSSVFQEGHYHPTTKELFWKCFPLLESRRFFAAFLILCGKNREKLHLHFSSSYLRWNTRGSVRFWIGLAINHGKNLFRRWSTQFEIWTAFVFAVWNTFFSLEKAISISLLLKFPGMTFQLWPSEVHYRLFARVNNSPSSLRVRLSKANFKLQHSTIVNAI